MKVRHIDHSSGLSGLAVVEDRRSGPDPGVSFARQLTHLNERNYQMHMRELHECICAQGRFVAQKADLGAFQNYRVLIARFIHEAVSNAYSFHKENRYGARGRHMACALIKTINAKLDEMAKEVLSEQADNLKIMGMAEEIRGMLVDLYL